MSPSKWDRWPDFDPVRLVLCGRYATTLTAASLNQEFEIDLANSFAELEPDYNVAPTKESPVVLSRVHLATPRMASRSGS